MNLRRPNLTLNKKGIGAIAVLGILALSPLVLLYLVYGYFALSEGRLKQVDEKSVVTPQGFKLAYYQKLADDADLDVIFIHGTPGDANAFHKQFETPFPRANLFAVDRPGFGHSEGEIKIPSLDNQVKAIGALLLDVGPGAVTRKRRRILVGHSYGCPVALQIALTYPEQVSGLLLIGASLDPELEQVLAVQNFGNTKVISFVLPAPMRVANRELITLKADLERLERKIGELNVPVVMLHGVKDPLVPVANVDFLEKQLGRAGKLRWFSKRVYKDFNHFIPWEQPTAVTQALWDLHDRLGIENTQKHR